MSASQEPKRAPICPKASLIKTVILPSHMRFVLTSTTRHKQKKIHIKCTLLIFFFFIKLWSCTEQIVSAQGHTKAAFQRNHLDSERNEAVVSLNVSLEDFGAGPEHSFEAGPVQLHTLEGSTCHHRGRPGPVEQQGYLTKII